MAAVVHPAAVVAATERLLQLPDRGVEHGAKIGSARFGAHRRTRAPTGDLHSLAHLGQARIVLVTEHDVIADDAADVAAVALEAACGVPEVGLRS
jgi:hypothetical protein